MTRHYVERAREDFDALLVERLKFEVIDIPGTEEIVYQRNSTRIPWGVRVYSSVHVRTGRTRDCGDDAIRVVMVDLETGRPRKIMGEGPKSKAGRRINRTKSAMVNLEKRVKQYLMLGTDQYLCPTCGGLMAVRKSKTSDYRFLGCTNWEPGGDAHASRHLPEWLD